MIKEQKVGNLRRASLFVVSMSAFLLASCATTPEAPSVPPIQAGAGILNGPAVAGPDVYVKLEREGAGWRFGPLAARYAMPTASAIWVRLNDLRPMIEGTKHAVQIVCELGSSKCKDIALQEARGGINFGPFAQIQSSDGDVAVSILGNILDAGGMAGPNGKPLGPRYLKTLEFNFPAYQSALMAANETSAYVTNRGNVVAGFNDLRAKSATAISSAHMKYVVAKIIDRSGLYVAGSVQGMSIGGPLAGAARQAIFTSATPAADNQILPRYIDELESDPTRPYPAVVSDMLSAYRTTPVAYDVSCGGNQYDGEQGDRSVVDGFYVVAQCPTTVAARVLEKSDPTSVPVTLTIESLQGFQLFPRFAVRNGVMLVEVTPNRVRFSNLSDDYEIVKKISIYWKKGIVTRTGLNITLPPDGASSYDMSAFNINDVLKDATRSALRSTNVSTGIAVMYSARGVVHSLYRRVYVSGPTLVRRAIAQYH